jgi:hypothetical protein
MQEQSIPLDKELQQELIRLSRAHNRLFCILPEVLPVMDELFVVPEGVQEEPLLTKMELEAWRSQLADKLGSRWDITYAADHYCYVVVPLTEAMHQEIEQFDWIEWENS